MKFVFNFQLYFETSEIRPNFDLFSKFLKKIEISDDNIFHLRVSKYSKISIISKNMRDMKMNQKSKMWHLTCSTRLCSLKLHWISFPVPWLKKCNVLKKLKWNVSYVTLLWMIKRSQSAFIIFSCFLIQKLQFVAEIQAD